MRKVKAANVDTHAAIFQAATVEFSGRGYDAAGGVLGIVTTNTVPSPSADRT